MDTNKMDLTILKQKIEQNENFDKNSTEYEQYKQSVEDLYFYIKDLLTNAETIVENFRNKNRIIIGIELRLDLLGRSETTHKKDFKDITKKYIRNDMQILEILRYIEQNINKAMIKKDLKLIHRKQTCNYF